MDSGNSGSIQSSSGGGDEEFDSRFFHSSPQPQSQPQHQHQHQHQPQQLPNSFDSLSYLNASSLLPTNPSPLPRPPLLFTNSSSSSSSSSIVSQSMGVASNLAAASTTNTIVNAPRSSKKRSRASRRAPTTVLTTDTSNFRAMVQEFTGIPSPPFAPSPIPRARFDHLFAASSPSSSLLRPFAHKLQPNPNSNPNPNPNSTSLIDAVAITTNNISHPNHSQALLNIQSPSLLTYQSLLQSQLNPQYNIGNVLSFGSRPPPTMVASSSSAEFGPGEIGLLPSGLIGSDGLRSDPVEQHQLRPVVASFSGGAPQPRVSGCNVEKGPESVAATTRGEGMVESWICSSD
ncbi:uncharacterized protein [Typha angustifolia]|uniref:uncharacterized protein n=1 Tax=Typha angustifolia TaxID=59011 RepID=UPI003C2EDAF3